jgi:hypothetical protein
MGGRRTTGRPEIHHQAVVLDSTETNEQAAPNEHTNRSALLPMQMNIFPAKPSEDSPADQSAPLPAQESDFQVNSSDELSVNRSTPLLAQDKASQVKWTEEMTEALVECIYGVWKDGKASDNGFKKEVWIQASEAVMRAYDGPLVIGWDKCKNKWGDLKEKWKHWLNLSEMSGFGWNDEKEKFEAYDYVWERLNKSHPRIIWHKTHVMPHRELLAEILFEAQATGKAAISGSNSNSDVTPTDPYHLDTSASASPAPNTLDKMRYNKSKKRVRAEISDDEAEQKPVLKKERIDLPQAIAGMTAEMVRGRKAREEADKYSPQKAVQLLESAYGGRLDPQGFVDCCMLLEEERKARLFLAITSTDRRDLWLEINAGIVLKPSE